MGKLLLLIAAAGLEVGGDALMRLGIREGRAVGIVLGALALAAYGIVVNLSPWDFGRLLGVYIAVFFLVSQLLSVAAFHDELKPPTLVGGPLIVAGGLVLTFWKCR
ncbi:MAG TPA: hypothetical protein VGS41_11695 [Chthonomonadales bacterium]|nr:hypothetical protein [Chthonomonadales bacterium]